MKNIKEKTKKAIATNKWPLFLNIYYLFRKEEKEHIVREIALENIGMYFCHNVPETRIYLIGGCLILGIEVSVERMEYDIVLKSFKNSKNDISVIHRLGSYPLNATLITYQKYTKILKGLEAKKVDGSLRKI